MNASVSPHKFVSQDEWLAARRDLLNEEKQLTKQQQRIAAARRALPWMTVTSEPVFRPRLRGLCLGSGPSGRRFESTRPDHFSKHLSNLRLRSNTLPEHSLP